MVIFPYGRFFLALIFAAAILWVSKTDAATLRAKVVDAETAEALEGVGIVVVWYRSILHPLCMDSCYKFGDAAEAITDDQGDFSIKLSPWWPTRRIQLVFFKPGYRAVEIWGRTSRDIELRNEPVIGMVKIKSLEDQVRDGGHVSVCHFDPIHKDPWCVPPKKIKNYVRLRELQRKIFGDQE